MSRRVCTMGDMQTPTPFIAPEVFDNADAALVRVQAIYEQSVTHLRQAMQRYVAGDDLQDRVRACYPSVRIETATDWTPPQDLDAELLSYGFVASAGSYSTTITRPDLFAHYLREQFALLIRNHGVRLEVGTSKEPMPVHFSFAENEHMEGEMSAARRARLRDVFDLPDLTAMDDSIANGTWQGAPPPASPSRWPCFRVRAPTIRCTACATTPAPARCISRTMCCSPITSSTSTSSSPWDTPKWPKRTARTRPL